MCMGRQFQIDGAETEKADEQKVASNTGRSGQKICNGGTQGPGQNTHTRAFNGPFSGTTWASRYQKGKPIWILQKQDSE